MIKLLSRANNGLEIIEECYEFKSSGNQYFDEYSNKLAKPSSPIGDWGLDSYRTIDDAISEALGIPLAPD